MVNKRQAAAAGYRRHSVYRRETSFKGPNNALGYKPERRKTRNIEPGQAPVIASVFLLERIILFAEPIRNTDLNQVSC